MTIAVFDSGFGGLTVLRALLPLIPGADYLYLGDTARLPYGAKSPQTITRYALSSAAFLLAQGADLLVVACNTASALALEDLQRELPIPALGVIEPGVQAASNATNPGAPSFASLAKGGVSGVSPTILILATAATVQSAAYTHTCAAYGLLAYEKACPLLVPLVEEGWIDHLVTAEVLRIYLTEALAAAPTVTTLVLGCTHYPLLAPLIERTLLTLNHPLRIIDSATATAQAARQLLLRNKSPGAPSQTAPSSEVGNKSLGAPSQTASPSEVGNKSPGAPPQTASPSEVGNKSPGAPSQTAPSSEVGTCTFYATDSIEKFQRLGSAFLGQPLPQVHLIDLGG